MVHQPSHFKYTASGKQLVPASAADPAAVAFARERGDFFHIRNRFYAGAELADGTRFYKRNGKYYVAPQGTPIFALRPGCSTLPIGQCGLTRGCKTDAVSQRCVNATASNNDAQLSNPPSPAVLSVENASDNVSQCGHVFGQATRQHLRHGSCLCCYLSSPTSSLNCSTNPVSYYSDYEEELASLAGSSILEGELESLRSVSERDVQDDQKRNNEEMADLLVCLENLCQKLSDQPSQVSTANCNAADLARVFEQLETMREEIKRINLRQPVHAEERPNDDVTRLQSELEQMRAKCTTATAALEAARAEIARQKEELQRAKEELEQTRAGVSLAEGTTANAALEAARAEIARQKEELQRANEELEQTRANYAMKTAEVEAAHAEIARQKEDCQSAKDELEQTRANYTIKTAEVEAAHAEIDVQKGYVQRTEKALEEMRAGFKEGTYTVTEAVHAEIARQKEELQRTQNELEQTRANYAMKTAEAEAAHAEITRQKEDCQSTKDELEQTRVNYAEKTAEVEAAHAEIARQKEDCQSAKDELERLRAEPRVYNQMKELRSKLTEEFQKPLPVDREQTEEEIKSLEQYLLDVLPQEPQGPTELEPELAKPKTPEELHALNKSVHQRARALKYQASDLMEAREKFQQTQKMFKEQQAAHAKNVEHEQTELANAKAVINAQVAEIEKAKKEIIHERQLLTSQNNLLENTKHRVDEDQAKMRQQLDELYRNLMNRQETLDKREAEVAQTVATLQRETDVLGNKKRRIESEVESQQNAEKIALQKTQEFNENAANEHASLQTFLSGMLTDAKAIEIELQKQVDACNSVAGGAESSASQPISEQTQADEARVVQMRRMQETIENERAVARQNLELCKAESASKTKTITELQGSLSLQETKVVEAREKVKAQMEEIAELKANLMKEASNTPSTEQADQSQVKDLQRQNTELQARLRKAQSDYETKKSHLLYKQNIELENSDSAMNNLKHDLQSKQEEVDRLVARDNEYRNAVQAGVERANIEHSQVQSRLKSVSDEAAALKAQLVNANVAYEELARKQAQIIEEATTKLNAQKASCIEQCQSRLDDMQRVTSQTEASNATLKADNQQLQEKVAALLMHQNETSNTFQNQLQEAEAKLVACNKKREDEQASYSRKFKEQQETLENEANHAYQQMDAENKARAARDEEQRLYLETVISQLKIERKELEANLLALRENGGEPTAVTESLKQELNSTRQNLKETETRLQAALEESAQSQFELSQMASNEKHCKLLLEEARKQNAAASDEWDRQRERAREAFETQQEEARLKQVEANAAQHELENRIVGLTTKLTNAINKLEALETENSALTNEIALAKEKITAQNVQIEQLQSLDKEVTEKREATENALEEANEKIKRLEQYLEGAQNKAQELDEEIKKNKQDIQGMTNRLETMASDKEILVQQSTDLQQQIQKEREGANQRVASLSHDMSQWVSMSSRLRSQLESITKRIGMDDVEIPSEPVQDYPWEGLSESVSESVERAVEQPRRILELITIHSEPLRSFLNVASNLSSDLIPPSVDLSSLSNVEKVMRVLFKALPILREAVETYQAQLSRIVPPSEGDINTISSSKLNLLVTNHITEFQAAQDLHRELANVLQKAQELLAERGAVAETTHLSLVQRVQLLARQAEDAMHAARQAESNYERTREHLLQREQELTSFQTQAKALLTDIQIKAQAKADSLEGYEAYGPLRNRLRSIDSLQNAFDVLNDLQDVDMSLLNRYIKENEDLQTALEAARQGQERAADEYETAKAALVQLEEEKRALGDEMLQANIQQQKITDLENNATKTHEILLKVTQLAYNSMKALGLHKEAERLREGSLDDESEFDSMLGAINNASRLLKDISNLIVNALNMVIRRSNENNPDVEVGEGHNEEKESIDEEEEGWLDELHEKTKKLTQRYNRGLLRVTRWENAIGRLMTRPERERGGLAGTTEQSLQLADERYQAAEAQLQKLESELNLHGINLMKKGLSVPADVIRIGKRRRLSSLEPMIPPSDTTQ